MTLRISVFSSYSSSCVCVLPLINDKNKLKYVEEFSGFVKKIFHCQFVVFFQMTTKMCATWKFVVRLSFLRLSRFFSERIHIWWQMTTIHYIDLGSTSIKYLVSIETQGAFTKGVRFFVVTKCPFSWLKS